MVYIQPFKGIRPEKSKAEQVSALPYDVMNRAEAKEMAAGNPFSFLHISRSEIDLPDSVGDYEPSVYAKARENLDRFIAEGTLLKEAKLAYYIYRETMNGQSQTGLVAAVSVRDYLEGTVVKHEFTRKEKEQDRINHFDVCSCHTEPSFLTCKPNSAFELILKEWTESHEAEYDFVADDGVGHALWVIDDGDVQQKLTDIFGGTDKVYIADGHHRTASSAAIMNLRNSAGEGDKPCDFFMAVIFPSQELQIMAYNRVVKTPEGLSRDELINELKKVADIAGDSAGKKHRFSVYTEGEWIGFDFMPEYYNNADPVDNLDCAILQKNVLEPVFGIEDPRTDKRIDFIGGIRGLKEIEKRCKEEGMIGFALHPVDIADLMNIADGGGIMPPKSTWFEPKLRSGLFLHEV